MKKVGIFIVYIIFFFSIQTVKWLRRNVLATNYQESVGTTNVQTAELKVILETYFKEVLKCYHLS